MSKQSEIIEAAKKQYLNIEEYITTHAGPLALASELINAIPGIIVYREACSGYDYDIGFYGNKEVMKRANGAMIKAGFGCVSGDNLPETPQASWTQCWHLDACTVWLFYSSTQCKRVKVGTEIVNQDIYEVVCE